MRSIKLCIALALLSTACTPPPIARLHPHLQPLTFGKPLPCSHSPFPQLSGEEKCSSWGQELMIGEGFARERDFYRAITAFKRALFLLPCEKIARRQQLEYEILLSYYLAGRYQDLVNAFKESTLACDPEGFPAMHDLLLLLFDTLVQLKDPCAATHIRLFIQQRDPELGNRLELSQYLMEGQLQKATQLPQAPSYLQRLSCEYQQKRKSIKTAETLSALLPGAGFWYSGQKNAAITALLLNGLFLFATYQCFHKGLVAPGIILGSLELGWYTGGIYGSGQAAADYNAHLYQSYGNKVMEQEGLYPLLMLNYTY